MKKIIVFIILFMIGIIFILTYLYHDNYTWTKDEMDNNKVLSQNIIDALKKYKQENGKYPQNLELLVPKHIGVIPKLKDAKFTYVLDNENDIFYLSFHGWHSCDYDSKTKKWTYDNL